MKCCSVIQLRYKCFPIAQGGDASGGFVLGTVNGTLYLTAMLDYEAVKGYTIVISGVDGGVLPRSAYVIHNHINI